MLPALRFLLFLAAATLSLGCAARQPAGAQRSADRLLLLVSIDGFRWDYLDVYRKESPHLRALADGGVHARRMTSCFPSKTFPNHYTIVTGLRPEHHGIVDNWFFDPKLGEMFGLSKTETKWWDGGEPVWITAEKQGVRAGCFFWPGSETVIQGRLPTRHLPFNGKLTCNERVDGLLGWLDKPPAERPRFLTLYFDVVDHAGHESGPESRETAGAVQKVDVAIARLLEGLAAHGLRDRTDIIVVSDHGMAATGTDKVIFLDDLVNGDDVQIEATGPNAGLRPRPGAPSPGELVAAIRPRLPPHVKVYLRENIPARFHYSHSNRIAPVVLIADQPWMLEPRKNWEKRSATYVHATHGWDPNTPEMGAFFAANGPSFPRGRIIGDFENIHLYNLFCHLLGIQPAPNDGDDRLLRIVK